ncbi:MAG: AAA family ATPase [Umezawaea sp.]
MTVLLDRDRELACLTGALKAASAGHGSLVTIRGPLGAGRSTLLRAAADLARQCGMEVMRAVASTAERNFPFGVVRQLCEPAVAAMSDATRASVLGGVAESIRPLFATGGNRADAESLVPVEHALLHGIRHLLAALGTARPVVVLVDDLPWADDQSVRCLGYLAARLAGLRVVIVVTLRDGDPDAERTLVRDTVDQAQHDLRLNNLSRTAVRTMARQQFRRDGDEAYIDALCDSTGGNPLLLRSILTELGRGGTQPLGSRADEVHACRPPALHALVLSRLRVQPASTRAFLSALCCVEGVPGGDLVGNLAGLDAVERMAVARSLAEQGLVLPGRAPRFIHPVVREAAEDLTGEADGQRLHLKAAELLYSAGHQAEDVAAHLLAVPSFHDPWALAALCAAAESAALRGAHGTAARYLRRALLDSSNDGVERADLLVRLAGVECATDTGAAARHLLEAMPLLASVTDRAEAVVLLTPMALAAIPDEAVDVLRDIAKGLGEAEFLAGSEKELALRVDARLRYLGGGDDLLEAVRELQRNDCERDIRSPGGRELLAVLLHSAMVTGRAKVDDLLPVTSRVLRLESPESARLHSALPLLVGVLAFADGGNGISAWLEVAHDDARRRRDAVADAVVGVDRALLALCRGQVGEGGVLAENSMALLGDRWFDTVATLGVFLGAAALEMPDLTLARRIITRCEERSAHPAVSTMRALLGVSEAATPAALERLLDCGRHLERVGWGNPAVIPWRSKAAEVHSGLGNVEAAVDLAEAEVEAACAWGAPVAIARGFRVLGAVTPDAAGALLTREALDVLDRSENHVERARIELQLARLLRSSRPDEAARHAANGRALAEASGARGVLGWPAGAGAEARAPGLTAAESRVAGAVATGRTNQSVADEFGISSRAVEKHLTSAYRKLGIAGRPELKAALSPLLEP